jgi:hypothetical protein
MPYLVAPKHGSCLSEALPKSLATNTWKKWSRRSFGGSLLPLPRWTEGMEDVTEPYVWPNTEEPPVVAPCTRSWDRQVNVYVKWTTMFTTCVFVESSSTTFVRERNPHFRSSRVS